MGPVLGGAQEQLPLWVLQTGRALRKAVGALQPQGPLGSWGLLGQGEKQVPDSGKMALGPHGPLGLPVGRVGLQTKGVCRFLALSMVGGQWRVTPGQRQLLWNLDMTGTRGKQAQGQQTGVELLARQDWRLGGRRTYCREARGWQRHRGARQAQARLWAVARHPRKGAALRPSLPTGEG